MKLIANRHVILLTLLLLVLLPWPVVEPIRHFDGSGAVWATIPVISLILLLAAAFGLMIENIAILIIAIAVSYFASSYAVARLKKDSVRKIEIILLVLILITIAGLFLIALTTHPVETISRAV